MVADEEEEEEGNDIKEEESQKLWSLVAALKILSLPICLLHKRKEVDLSPGSVKERAETLLVANCARLESEAPELKVDKDNSMPPPSIVPSQVPSGSSSSSHLFYPTNDLLFTTSSRPYMRCRGTLLTSKSSLHWGNIYTWRKLLSWRTSWRVTSKWLLGCRYTSLLGSFGKLSCISLFLRLLIILVDFCSWPWFSSSLTSSSSTFCTCILLHRFCCCCVLNRGCFSVF